MSNFVSSHLYYLICAANLLAEWNVTRVLSSWKIKSVAECFVSRSWSFNHALLYFAFFCHRFAFLCQTLLKKRCLVQNFTYKVLGRQIDLDLYEHESWASFNIVYIIFNRTALPPSLSCQLTNKHCMLNSFCIQRSMEMNDWIEICYNIETMFADQSIYKLVYNFLNHHIQSDFILWQFTKQKNSFFSNYNRKLKQKWIQHFVSIWNAIVNKCRSDNWRTDHCKVFIRVFNWFVCLFLFFLINSVN